MIVWPAGGPLKPDFGLSGECKIGAPSGRSLAFSPFVFLVLAVMTELYIPHCHDVVFLQEHFAMPPLARKCGEARKRNEAKIFESAIKNLQSTMLLVSQMIRMALQNRERAIQLLQQHDSRQLMGHRHLPQRNHALCR